MRGGETPQEDEDHPHNHQAGDQQSYLHIIHRCVNLVALVVENSEVHGFGQPRLELGEDRLDLVDHRTSTVLEPGWRLIASAMPFLAMQPGGRLALPLSCPSITVATSPSRTGAPF